MKNIVLLMILFCSISYGQGWNTTVTTSINEPNLEKMDLFTNSYGNFALIKRTNGTILCYRLNSSGQLIIPDEEAPNPIIFSANGDFPAITGSSAIVYAFYREGSNIKGRYSTNGGNIWLNLPDRPTTANISNGIDAVYQGGLSGGVHLVWATRDAGSDFKTYYSRLTPHPDHNWVEFQDVTNHVSAPVGGNPSVTFSSDRVHVSFNTDNSNQPWVPGIAIARERYNGVWQTPEFVFSGSEESIDEKLIVRGSLLYLFYSRFYALPIRNDLYYRTRNLSGGIWSSPELIRTNIYQLGNAFTLCKTTNDNINLLYMHMNDGLQFTAYNGSVWSNPFNIDNNPKMFIQPGFAAVSNDLYLIWATSGDSRLRYKQNDQNPLTPANFAGGIHDVGWNAYPKITWSAVNEPDVRENHINGIIIERSLNHGTFTVVRNLSGQATSFIDWDVPYAGSGNGSARYRIKARDKNAHESLWSIIVNIAYGDAWKIGADDNIVSVKPENFYLSSNYPNPFNPSTRINYALPEEASVRLKVYDMLGSEVAVLVNETKRAGYHIVDFDASNLSSGVYIYRLTAANNDRILFTDTKKMLLMK